MAVRQGIDEDVLNEVRPSTGTFGKIVEIFTTKVEFFTSPFGILSGNKPGKFFQNFIQWGKLEFPHRNIGSLKD